MFDIGSSELLLIVIVAVVVIGPKDLPRALYKVGQVVGKARGMARHFRSGLDAMVREAELEELQKQWAQENARIMAANPMTDLERDVKPLADEVAGANALPAPDEVAHSGYSGGSSDEPVHMEPSTPPAPPSASAVADPAAPKDGAA
jgi:sec-independent protein translocase protein TatB